MADPLAEKAVQPAIKPDHIAYCPTMDLISLATVDEQVHVYRLNGQKVFGVQNKQLSAKVSKVKWKPNGEIDLNVCSKKTAESLELKATLLPLHTAITLSP